MTIAPDNQGILRSIGENIQERNLTGVMCVTSDVLHPGISRNTSRSIRERGRTSVTYVITVRYSLVI